jgi:hypothetical protein
MNVAVTETVVGGCASNLLLRALACAAEQCPNLRLRMLLHRHTIHQANPLNPRLRRQFTLGGGNRVPIDYTDTNRGRVEKILNLSTFNQASANDLARARQEFRDVIPTQPLPTLPPTQQPWGHQMDVNMISGRYVLAEDVNMFLTRGTRQPLVLFNQRNPRANPEIMELETGPMDARTLLQMIVAGAFDGVFASMGIDLSRPAEEMLDDSHRKGTF